MAAMREETSRVVFCEAWVEFMNANAQDLAEQNARGKTVNEIPNLQSTQVFHTSPQQNMQLILPSTESVKK